MIRTYGSAVTTASRSSATATRSPGSSPRSWTQGRWGLHDSRIDRAPFQLFENGKLIAQSEGFFGSYAVSGSPASYRAELDVTRTAPYWTQSTNTHTTWTFASAPPPAGGGRLPPLLGDYDIGRLDLQNRCRADTVSLVRTGSRERTRPRSPG